MRLLKNNGLSIEHLEFARSVTMVSLLHISRRGLSSKGTLSKSQLPCRIAEHSPPGIRMEQIRVRSFIEEFVECFLETALKGCLVDPLHPNSSRMLPRENSVSARRFSSYATYLDDDFEASEEDFFMDIDVALGHIAGDIGVAQSDRFRMLFCLFSLYKLCSSFQVVQYHL